MRLNEGRDVSSKRLNGKLGRIASFRSPMAARFNRNSPETWVCGEGFSRLPRVPTQSVLEYYLQPIPPCIIHIQDR